MHKMLVLHLVLLTIVAVVQCSDVHYSSGETRKSNILVLSPFTMPSHSNFIRPVVEELAKRGHTVTYWNGLKPAINDKSLNLRQLYSESLGEFNSDQRVSFADTGKQLSLFLSIYGRLVNICRLVYEDPIFHQLMNTEEKFYLVIVEGLVSQRVQFLNECV